MGENRKGFAARYSSSHPRVDAIVLGRFDAPDSVSTSMCGLVWATVCGPWESLYKAGVVASVLLFTRTWLKRKRLQAGIGQRQCSTSQEICSFFISLGLSIGTTPASVIGWDGRYSSSIKSAVCSLICFQGTHSCRRPQANPAKNQQTHKVNFANSW